MTKVLPIVPGQTVVVFTDLDGTLIDHHTYSAEQALDAIRSLQSRGWPLVFCSSKTFAEQVELQGHLGITAPFIVENGSAVIVPKDYFKVLPEGYRVLEHHLMYPLAHADAAALRAELARFQHIHGFSSVSDAALADITGLSGEALSRARDRWFTETLVTPLDDAQASALAAEIGKKSWALSKGGRFYTVLSDKADKGRAMRWLAKVFSANLPAAPLLAAVGDSPNDFPMLAEADFPFLVQKHDGSWAGLELPGLQKIDAVGPKGFSQAVRKMMGE